MVLVKSGAYHRFLFSHIFINVKSLGTRYDSINFLDVAFTQVHKVRWDDWSRADGTKTTWEDESRISTTSWNSVQRYIRQEKAATSLEIDVLHTTDIHNTLTYLRNQAGQEKAKLLKSVPQSNFLEEMNRNIAYHQEIGNLPGSYTGYTSKTRRTSTRQKTGISLASSSSSALLRSQSKLSMQSSIATSSVGSATLESSSQSSAKRSPMKRIRRRIESPDSDTEVGPSIPPSHRPASPTASQSRPVPVIERFETPAIRLVVSLPFLVQYVKTSYGPIMHRRMELQNLWSSKAEKRGAAPISFCNDVDDEAVPPISPNFCYLEANYKLLSSTIFFCVI